MASDPRRLGALFGLLAAVSFGVSAPLAKLLLAAVSPQLLAGLLYLGAGVGLGIYRLLRPPTREAPTVETDEEPAVNPFEVEGAGAEPADEDQPADEEANPFGGDTNPFGADAGEVDSDDDNPFGL